MAIGSWPTLPSPNTSARFFCATGSSRRVEGMPGGIRYCRVVLTGSIRLEVDSVFLARLFPLLV